MGKMGFVSGGAVGLIWIGWRFTPVLVTLHVLVCLVLIAVIMLQSGEAADLGGRFRRRGQPDGVWAARRGDVSFSRDHVVRDHVHDDVADAFGETRPTAASAASGSFWSRLRRPARLLRRRATSRRSPGQTSQPPASAPAPARRPQPLLRKRPRRRVRLHRNSSEIAGSAVSLTKEILGAYGSARRGRGGTGRRTSLRGWR